MIYRVFFPFPVAVNTPSSTSKPGRAVAREVKYRGQIRRTANQPEEIAEKAFLPACILAQAVYVYDISFYHPRTT